jgi:hypothetical protein
MRPGLARSPAPPHRPCTPSPPHRADARRTHRRPLPCRVPGCLDPYLPPTPPHPTPVPLVAAAALQPPQGNYPVVREDASQMCALQVQAEHASTLMDSEDQLLLCIEKYITKQVRAWEGGAGRVALGEAGGGGPHNRRDAVGGAGGGGWGAAAQSRWPRLWGAWPRAGSSSSRSSSSRSSGSSLAYGASRPRRIARQRRPATARAAAAPAATCDAARGGGVGLRQHRLACCWPRRC